LRVLFVLVVLDHHRRRLVPFNVTEHPTAEWTAQPIVDAFLDDAAPSYLLRHPDTVYGDTFRQRVRGMRIREVLTAAQSPGRARSWNGSLARSAGSALSRSSG
jgi:hypothetical protein